MPVISLIQHKGGSGKTTAVLGLALAAKQERPSRVVQIVDLDRQQSATSWVKDNELPFEVHHDFSRISPEGLVLVDTPGLDPVTTAEGLRRADLVLVPLRASMLDWTVTRMTIRAITGAKRKAAWLPAQQDTRRLADRDLAVRTLPDAMASGDIPDWPILPGIRLLAGVPVFLSGLTSPAGQDFLNNWRAIKKLLPGRV